MRPLSDVTPKPMLPVGDRPLAAHAADAAVAAGADELIFVVGYRASHVRAHFGREYGGVPVRYATQASAEGTADAVRAAREFLDDRFAVLNGDNLFDEASVVDLFERDAAVAAHRVADPSEYGVLSTDGGTVTGVVEKPAKPPSSYANAGAYVFPESTVDDLDVPESERGERELTDVLSRVIDREEVAAVEMEHWLDVARPGDLLSATELVLAGENCSGVAAGAAVHPDATLEGPVVVRQGASVGSGARITGPAVVGPDASVAGSATVERSVLLAGASVDPNVTLRGVVVGPDCRLTGNCIAGVTREDGHGAASVVAGEPEFGPLQY
jgi:bifunctional UDP-N-acetylglucosamine pyrophosphorylase/glucosamine-1-phosphate N-acetyltransferase